MTPKERSEELISKFMGHVSYGRDHDDELWAKGNAKECAIICVEQIIVATGADKDENNGYWHRVLEHLKSS